MSMNLHFCTKSGGFCIDFPFQTPTKLTLSVMAEKDNTKRLKLIREHLVTSGWEQDNIDSVMTEVEIMVNNPNVELSYM